VNLETVYLDHDNYLNLILKADGAAVDLVGVTRMTLSVGKDVVDSDNGGSDPIQWAKLGYATGEIRLFLGAEDLTPGDYLAPLIVYDPTNTDGVVWGNILLSVEADPEVTSLP
jgi:hypothetical protein